MRARYVVGCDGARSGIRTAIGRELVGDPMNQTWGVMDVLAVTDFPDIRLKSAILSANSGNLLVIPIANSTLYVEPIYLQAESSRLPELKRVVVATGNRLAMDVSLDDVLARTAVLYRPETRRPYGVLEWPAMLRLLEAEQKNSGYPPYAQ